MGKAGIVLIAIEREEQINKHGKSIESDIKINDDKELAHAASALAYPYHYAEDPDDYPNNWDREVIAKMIQKPYKERLIISGALIAAELDRLNAIEGILIIKSKHPILTVEMKLEAFAVKYYNGMQWEPKKGDYYTTTRSDLELYQIADIDDDFVYTIYTDRECDVQKWDKDKFITQDFGIRRMWIPDYLIKSHETDL